MTDVLNSTDKNKLKLYITKIESLEADKNEITENIREVFKEISADGFDIKIVRQIIKLRKMKEETRKEAEILLDLYKAAIEMD